MTIRLFPLQLYFVLMTIMVMTTSLQNAFFPRLIMLNAKRLEYNKSTVYELNCSSARQSVGNSAEFKVNGQTKEHISFHNNICYNSKKKECTTDHCLCRPNDNVYIYYYENKEPTAEFIIGCQMRFIDNETSRIIKVVTSLRINESVMELYEYDAKILTKDKEKDEQENNSTFEKSLWIPIICGVLLVVSVALTVVISRIFRHCDVSKKGLFQKERNVHGALEEKCQAVFQNTIRKSIRETLSDGYNEKEVSSVFCKTIQKIIQETMIKEHDARIDKGYRQESENENHDLENMFSNDEISIDVEERKSTSTIEEMSAHMLEYSEYGEKVSRWSGRGQSSASNIIVDDGKSLDSGNKSSNTRSVCTQVYMEQLFNPVPWNIHESHMMNYINPIARTSNVEELIRETFTNTPSKPAGTRYKEPTVKRIIAAAPEIPLPETQENI